MGRDSLPVRAGFLARPRINALLKKGMGRSLVTVVAAMGYGKTQSVAAFARDAKQRLIWLALTRYDNDADRFWRKLVAATAHEMPALAERLAAMPYPTTADMYGEVLRLLAQEAYQGEPILLVLDDYDALFNLELRTFAESLVEARLENLCMVVISNRRTDISVIGLKSTYGLMVIDEEDLRYTPDEADAYLRHRGIALGREAVERITRETEGWPLPLSLYAARHKETPDHAPQDLRCTLLNEMFERECYAAYPEEVRMLLIRLSLLPCFSTEIVAAIGTEAAGEVVTELSRNMFIRHNASEKMFYMQAMYRDFLSLRHVLIGEEDRLHTYAVAGAWFEEAGRIAEALDCYRHCEDHDLYLRAIGKLEGQLQAKAFAEEILHCLDNMRPVGEEQAAVIGLSRGFMLLNNGRFAEGEAVFSRLVITLAGRARTPREDHLLGEAYLALADISLIRNTDAFIEYAPLALRYLKGPSTLRRRDILVVGNNDILFLTKNGPGELARMLREMERLAPIQEEVSNGSTYGFELLFAAEAAVHSCEMEQAKRLLIQTEHKASKQAQHDIVLNAYMLGVRISLYEGDCRKAQEYVRKGKAYVASVPPNASLQEIIECTEANYRIQVEDLDTLPAWMRGEEAGYLERMPVRLGRNSLYTIIYLMGKRRYADALIELRQYHSIFAEKGLWTIRLTVHLMEAVCYLHVSNLQRAVESFKAAYDMAAPDGLVMTFAEFGNVMRTLIVYIRQSKDHGMDEQWLDRVSRLSGQYARRRAAIIATCRKMGGREADAKSRLSARETEVLRYLAKGMTREEIAEQLGISINGVKKHITGVYNKLGAINRADAVRIAVAQGELGS